MFKKPFGPKSPPSPSRDIAALTASFAVPALHLVRTDTTTRSHLGGTQTLPDGFEWPERDGAALRFLARIELAELQAALALDWLPSTGTLLFFYDVENQPWGFDPKDRGSWHVACLPAQATESMRANPAEIVLPHRNVRFRKIMSLPSWEREQIEALELTDAESDTYIDLMDEPFQGKPQHQMGGYPSNVQGDEMELECQLASNGLYCGDDTGYRDPRADALRAGAAEWRLLLQLDSDDDLEIMWGDLGKIYFWVQESAARRADFSNAWLILQCS